MSYQTIMVHLQLGRENTTMLKVAKNLAHHFHSSVIGIATGQPTQKIYGEGYPLLNILNQEHQNIAAEISAVEMIFQEAFKAYSENVEWRSQVTVGSCAEYIACEASSADLIITESALTDFYEGPNRLNAGDIILQAGRPVLVVPTNATKLNFQNVLIGWKNTREARRAILDALPLLKFAKEITVIEIASDENFPNTSQQLKKIISWLEKHNIYAGFEIIISKGKDSDQFITYANSKNFDLVITGGYGHSRVREWIFGGVTNELLKNTNLCSFLSH